MNRDEFFRRVAESQDGYDILALDPEQDGSCPCFHVVLDDGTRIDGHCWRVTCDQHEGVGLHGDIPEYTGRLMALKLTEIDWYGEWGWTWITYGE